LTTSLLITMIDASNLLCGLLTACPTPSPSCKSIGPILFNVRVLMQPPLTSHLAVQSFASIRGDHFRHNSGDIEAVGFKFRMQATGMIARARAKFQGSAMKLLISWPQNHIFCPKFCILQDLVETTTSRNQVSIRQIMLMRKKFKPIAGAEVCAS